MEEGQSLFGFKKVASFLFSFFYLIVSIALAAASYSFENVLDNVPYILSLEIILLVGTTIRIVLNRVQKRGKLNYVLNLIRLILTVIVLGMVIFCLILNVFVLPIGIFQTIFYIEVWGALSVEFLLLCWRFSVYVIKILR